jgi:hypothetical protein
MITAMTHALQRDFTLEPCADGSDLGNVYCRILWALADLFPALAPAVLDQLLESGRLLARSVVCLDRVIDGDCDEPARAFDALAGHVCQFEGLRLLAGIIPPESGFWPRFHDAEREFAHACLQEHRLRSDESAWASAGEAAGIAIAVGKNALARAGGAALCEVAGRPDAAAEIDRAIRHLVIAVQALDDARDWRQDVAAGAPSLLVLRLRASTPSGAAGLRGDDAAIRRRLVEEGHLAHVLRLGHRHAQFARTYPAVRASARWRGEIDRLLAGYDGVLAMLAA